MRFAFRWLVVLLAAFLAAAALGQEVRDEGFMPAEEWHKANDAFADSSAHVWPTLKPGTTHGTQIRVSGDFRNCDLTLTTFKTYGEVRLLTLAKGLANALGRPQTDFVLTRGRRLMQVDLEFNKTIRRQGNVSESTIPLGRALDYLNASDLPRPLGVFVRRNEEGETVWLDGHPLAKSEVVDADRVSPGAMVRYRAERSLIGLVGAIGMAGLGVVIPVWLVWVIAKTVRNQRRPPEVAPASPPPASLAEAQRRYEATRKNRFARIGRGLAFLPALVVASAGPAFRRAGDWIPPGLMEGVLGVVLGSGIVFLATLFLLDRKDKKRKPRKANRRLAVGVIWFVAGLVFTVALSADGAALRRSLPASWIRPTLFFLLIPPLLLVLFELRRANPTKRIRLAAGDPDFDFAEETARKAGVRMRRFELVESAAANASAGLFGVVTITTAARDFLPKAERQAVVAHELGHLRHRHVPAVLLAALAVDAAVIAGNYLLEQHWNGPKWLMETLTSPVLSNVFLWGFISLLLSPIRRRNELSADRFALTTVGDYATVARALTRIHLIGGAPHTYAGFDQFSGSHPSLTRRLESLRRIAAELGMEADDSSLYQLFGQEPAREPAVSG